MNRKGCWKIKWIKMRIWICVCRLGICLKQTQMDFPNSTFLNLPCLLQDARHSSSRHLLENLNPWKICHLLQIILRHKVLMSLVRPSLSWELAPISLTSLKTFPTTSLMNWEVIIVMIIYSETTFLTRKKKAWKAQIYQNWASLNLANYLNIVIHMKQFFNKNPQSRWN